MLSLSIARLWARSTITQAASRTIYVSICQHLRKLVKLIAEIVLQALLPFVKSWARAGYINRTGQLLNEKPAARGEDAADRYREYTPSWPCLPS
jgi:hypothetical protein